MTKATLRQRLCGLSKRDQAKLKRSEGEVITIATKAAEEQPFPWLPIDPAARPTIYDGRIAWYVVSEKVLTRKPPPAAVYVDDETGQIIGVRRYPR